MISYEITREKKKVEPIRHIREVIASARGVYTVDENGVVVTEPTPLNAERLENQRRIAEGLPPLPRALQQQPHKQQQAAWVPMAQLAKQEREKSISDEAGSALPMGKHGYNTWMNGFVYNRFNKGVYVTLRSEPIVINRAPRVWFRVTELQEIHYMAMIDRESREPKAVGVNKPGSGHSIPTWYPPCKLRVLQPEELKHVIGEMTRDIIRDQEGEGEAAVVLYSAPTIEPADDPSAGRDPFEEEGPKEGDI